jgi:hypothetical protein
MIINSYSLRRAQEVLAAAVPQGDCLICNLTPSQVYAEVSRIGKAHILIWLAAGKEIPDGMFVCHSCDTPRCINIEHLFLGTPQDNMDDKVSKGRQHFGGPGRMLKPSQISEARELRNDHGWTFDQIANKIGVDRRTISRTLKDAYND